jgi:aspartokinase-like uncharacterized kinase
MRIVKLGGSLLTWAEWPNAFRRWLAIQPPLRTVVIVGGGGMVDVVRDWDRAHRLDPSDAHWLAIDAMSMTSRLAAHLLPEARWIDDLSALLTDGFPDQGEAPAGATGQRSRPVDAKSCGDDENLVILDPRQFLRNVEPTASGAHLPQSWDVTSDSIAARIADLLGSEELVLLKSYSLEPRAAKLDEMASAGFVDRGFPTFAAKLPLVRLVNLRDGSFSEVGFGQSEVGCVNR